MTEESTFGYGVSDFINTLKNRPDYDSWSLLVNARVINFPQNIAVVRAEQSRIEQEKSAHLRRAFKAETRLLELDLSGLEEITDRPPAYRRELSSRSDELMLYGAFDAMSVWVKPTIVVIVATDLRDRLFLLNEVRKSLPKALPVLLEMDYLSVHPDYRKISRGSLSIPTGKTLLCMTQGSRLTDCPHQKKDEATDTSQSQKTTSPHQRPADAGQLSYLSFPSDYAANMFRAVLGLIEPETLGHRESDVGAIEEPQIWLSTLAGFQSVGTEKRPSSKLLVADGRLSLEQPVPTFFLVVGALIIIIGGWTRIFGRIHLIMLTPLRHLNPLPGIRELDFQLNGREQVSSTGPESIDKRLNNLLSLLLILLGVVVFCIALWRLYTLNPSEGGKVWSLAHGRDKFMLACSVLVYISIAIVAGWRMYLWQRRSRTVFTTVTSDLAIASVQPAIWRYGKVDPGLISIAIVVLPLFWGFFPGLPTSVDSMVPAILTFVTLILLGVWFTTELLSEANRLANLAQILAPTLNWPANPQNQDGYPARPTNTPAADSWASPWRLRSLPQTPFSLRFRKRDLTALLACPDNEWKEHTKELVKGTWPFTNTQSSFEDWQARMVAEMRYALAAIRCCAWAAILAPTVLLLTTGIYPQFNERIVTISSVLIIITAFTAMMHVIIKFEQSPLLGRMFTLNGDRLSISGAVGALWGKVIAAAVILIPVLFPDVLSFFYNLFQSIYSLQ
ncbi:hypothetical protein [Kineobactrum salinum]|uniref:Uncharacterized protein n=1 Tax=Kineobactrum salinum TaxID=2708301 RepID=A0A6C0U9V7_9GAMM|nr:hypothetical protein [Kineobactrum salinum]QIB66504.1 hypothetical protein G3T16_14970 [Kineobactrum salinum]